MPPAFLHLGGFLVVMPRARYLTEAEWRQLDYRAFVTRGDGYVEANFDARAGEWRQGDLGQPLHPLFIGNAEPDAGTVPAEYKRDSFGVLNGRIVAVDYGKVRATPTCPGATAALQRNELGPLGCLFGVVQRTGACG